MGFLKKLEMPDEKSENFQKELVDVLRRHGVQLTDILNGGIKLWENIDCHLTSVTTPGADVELAVAHDLRRNPTGYLVVGINKPAQIYDSGTTWTADNIYIKCDQNNTTLTLLIF